MSVAQLAVSLSHAMETPRIRKRWSWVALALSVALVITTGVAATTAVQNTKLASQYATALDAASVGIVMTDQRGVILSANTPAQRMFGSAMIGRHIHSFCRTDESRDTANNAFASAMRDAKLAGALPTVELRCTLQSAQGPMDVHMHIRTLPRADDVAVVATITPAIAIKTIDLTGRNP